MQNIHFYLAHCMSILNIKLHHACTFVARNSYCSLLVAIVAYKFYISGSQVLLNNIA